MENKKYRVAAALITAAVLTAVSGCSSPGTSGGAQTEAESTAAGNSLPEAEKHQEADEVPEEMMTSISLATFTAKEKDEMPNTCCKCFATAS